MEEMTNDQIIEEIYKGNQGFITRREMDERKIPSWFLSSFVKKKDLKKIAPGFYAAPDFAVDDYWLLQTRYPQYIFSSMSALYLHHLTDKIPESIYVTGPQGYHPSRKPLPLLVIQNISKEEIYSLGIEEVPTMFGNRVKAYDKERTICDLIKYRDRYDGETFVKAIKAYAAGHPNQRKLFRYAKAMKIEKAVFEIMELVMNENE